MHTIETSIEQNKIKYTTKLLIMSYLSEICKKFFTYPELLNSMKIKAEENSEEILIFSIILSIFKTDNLIKEYEFKKLTRRAIIICLSFDEIAESEYMENESYLCEIIIEKLCTYYQMIPNYFDLAEDHSTLEVVPSISKTFPVMLNIYLEFRDFIYFFNKVCNTIRSIKLIEKLKIILFNKFLIEKVQDKLLSDDLKVIRSNLQYLLFILKSIKNIEIVKVIFNFMFGFDESKTNYNLRKNISKNVNPSENNENDLFLNLNKDYNYNLHDNIRIGLMMISNLNNNKESINIFLISFYDTFFEKCPYITINKLILPFSEVCLKCLENPEHLLQNKKTYPDMSHFFYLISIYEKKNFDISLINDNLEYNINRTYSHYINNDIDFYYYYLNERADQEKFQYINKGDEESELENNLNIEFDCQTPLKDNASNLYADLRTSLSKIPVKFNFNYFVNTRHRLSNLKPKLFEELIGIEEEYNNIYVK